MQGEGALAQPLARSAFDAAPLLHTCRPGVRSLSEFCSLQPSDLHMLLGSRVLNVWPRAVPPAQLDMARLSLRLIRSQRPFCRLPLAFQPSHIRLLSAEQAFAG